MAEQRYTIQEQLGAGGNGAVYRAYDRQLKRPVAIKRLLSADEATSSDPNVEELRREADTLALLRNANIVTIFDVATDAEGLFMVMELLEGPDLADAIAHGPLMFDDFKQLAEQTLEALLAAHNLRILHRDIKPENIKVERLAGGRLQAKIIDFGLARSGLAARKQTEDQEGSVMGSIYYMAPEQLSREPTDVRTDLYALGCVFYECLAGRKPFDGKSVNEVIDKHLDHDVVPLSHLCPHLPQWLTFWVMRLMACKPDDRPASAQQAIEEFRAWEKLPAMPGMMPWMPQGYGYAQPPVYTAPVPMAVYTGQVPLQTTGYFPVGAPPPHITSSSVPVQVQPESASVPIPVAQPVAPAAPVAQVPAGPRPAAPQRPGVKAPAPASNSKLKIVIPAAVVAAVACYVLFIKGKPRPPGAPEVASTSMQIGPAPEELYPQERNFPQPDSARVLHFTAKVATHGYLNDGSPAPKIDQGSLISVWEDVSKVGGNSPLFSKGQNSNNSPERIAWKTNDNAVKDGRAALQFKSKSGAPVVMQLGNLGGNQQSFPFGLNNGKNPSGLTLAVVFQADEKQLPAELLKLASDDGKNSLTVKLNAASNIEVELTTGAGTSQITSSGINVRTPSQLLLTWDRATSELKLRSRDQRGSSHTATGKAQSPDAPLCALQIGSDSAEKDRQFSGRIAELILLNTAQKDDQAALLDKELRDYYFNAAKPGALNPGKNPKLADFPVGEEREIFNGKDLSGWDGTTKYWSVKEGALTVKGDPSRTTGGVCNLFWKEGTVGDFELNAKFRSKGGGNSGVYYRAYVTGSNGDGMNLNGYQFDLDTQQKQRFGGLIESGLRSDLGKTGQNVRVKDNADVKKASLEAQDKAFPEAAGVVAGLKIDDWNDLRIVADGNRLKHFINGKQVLEVVDEGHGRQQSGVIGFEGQVRSGSTVQFKDVRLKRLK